MSDLVNDDFFARIVDQINDSMLALSRSIAIIISGELFRSGRSLG